MAARINEPGVQAALSTKLRDLPPGLLIQLAMLLPSNVAAGQSDQHAWLGSSPSMREWIGKRLVQSPDAFDFSIKNKKFEVSGVMPLDLLNNDKTGEAQLWLDDLVQALPLWYEEQIAGLINGAEAALCFDGQYFFDDDHRYGRQSATWSNDITFNASSHTAITVAEAAAAINAAIEAMRAFPDDQGRFIANRGMTAVDIIVKAGTANAAAIRQAITAERLDTGSTFIDNPLRGQDISIGLISDGLITLGETKMVVARSRRKGDARARPFALQENMAERRLDVLGENNATQFVVENDGYGVFLKLVGNAGYGLPSHAILTTFN
jgi:phage major head subunit gpT-like protein